LAELRPRREQDEGETPDRAPEDGNFQSRDG
jgi:hypothetical protein